MAKGNQLGPYLVTEDEVGNAYDQQVTVKIDGEVRYQGSTTEISHQAGAVFSWLESIAPIQPGTVVGFGTIPDCTGLDHDDFIDPNTEIEIAFERLGTLRCRFRGATMHPPDKSLASAPAATEARLAVLNLLYVSPRRSTGHSSFSRSSARYWIASAMWSFLTVSSSARSAIVRANFWMRWSALAESPILL